MGDTWNRGGKKSKTLHSETMLKSNLHVEQKSQIVPLHKSSTGSKPAPPAPSTISSVETTQRTHEPSF